jgi:glycosyltransferase involved in cell wall biosynthesis
LTVSVIIPARNEEACLGACLESLVAQSGVAFEIVLVDDHSTDRTREIASSFPHVRVIDPAPLPAGWTGKNNAVTAGARAAQGDWLLFTDADTVHLPGSLARSLAEVRERGVDLLSYSPRQIVKTCWEKAVMPVIFAELAATYRPADVSNPRSRAAAANGQYILVSRDAYDAVGGHASVASDLLEDVALARAIKHSGRAIFFRYGGDAVQTRMYRDFAQLREGWTKNLAALFASPARLAIQRSMEFFLIAAGVGTSVVEVQRGHWIPGFLATALAVTLYGLFFRRIRRAHFNWDANLFAFAGLPLFSCLLLRSARAYRRGDVSWKGRHYGGTKPRPESPQERNLSESGNLAME